MITLKNLITKIDNYCINNPEDSGDIVKLFFLGGVVVTFVTCFILPKVL